jgi:ribosomal protein S12 methylthiotransferase accessory factor
MQTVMEWAARTAAVESRHSTSLREVAAEQTLATIRPLLGDFGIRRIIDVSLDGVPSCPVFQVVRDDARSEYFNAGKGFTETESLVSGLMEAIEVHCHERAHPQLLIDHDTVAADVAATVLDSRGLVCESQSQTCRGPWLRGVSLVDGEPVYLPAAQAFRDLGDGGATPASPNGVASGNSAVEAASHALCEMLERHALADFARGTPLRAEWVTAPSELPHVQRCLQQLQAKGMAAHWLLISDLAGVAVFICFISLRDKDDQEIAVQGFGAHRDPTIAMARALGEAVQILALCPVSNEAEIQVSETGVQEGVVMTSKQAAMLDPQFIHDQRRSAHQLMVTLQCRYPVSELAYLFDDGRQGRGQTSRAALDEVVAGLRDEGMSRIYGAVISPPALPVVVVKCFCPGLECIAGL